MLKKITIAPVPIIVCRERLCEDELDYLSSYYNVNKYIKKKIKYPLDNLNFTTKIGNTEYEVSSSFDISGKQTILEQFQKLILSQN